MAATDSQRLEINQLIESLEQDFEGADAFADPRLLRRTEVCYSGQNSSAQANAAGGRYRGRWGRLLRRSDASLRVWG